MTFKDYCIYIFSHVNPGSTFLSISNYRNNFSEESDFTICFNASYKNAVSRSLDILKRQKGKDRFEQSVIDEMIQSFNWTLMGNNPLYTCQNVYSNIYGANGKVISGVKLHKNQDLVHVNGLKIKKKIKKKGHYPQRNMSPKTLIKNKFRAMTPLSNWSQFKLEPGRFSELNVQKMRIKG